MIPLHLVHSQCGAIIISSSKTLIAQKETPSPLRRRSSFSPPLQPLATTDLSASMDFPILDISYKWNHTVYDLLCLAS